VLPHDAHASYDIAAAAGPAGTDLAGTDLASTDLASTDLASTDLAGPVPHAMVSRVAEWALGDELDVIAHAAQVRFRPAISQPRRIA